MQQFWRLATYVSRRTIQRLESFARRRGGLYRRGVDAGGGEYGRQPVENRQCGDLRLYPAGAVQRLDGVSQRARAQKRNHAEERSPRELDITFS